MDLDETDLQAFVAARGAPSNEYDVADVFIDRIEEYVDTVKRDAQGNVVASSEGDDDRPDVMLAAHTDELALLIDSVTDDGFLRYTKVAGHYKGNFPGQRVVVGPDEILGVLGPKSRHYMSEEEKKGVDEQSLTIDIGATSREEVADLNVEPGDFATWDREYTHLANGHITGRALDDRIALAILVAIAKATKTNRTVHYAATVQEEVGLRGARMVGYSVNPDIGVALEIFPADDYPAADEPVPSAKVGAGPVVEFADGTSEYLFGGVLVDRETRTWLKRGAEAANVDVQEAIMTRGSTDATELQQVRGGRHAAAIAVPCRYTHSPVETIDLADAEETVATLLAALDTDFPSSEDIRR